MEGVEFHMLKEKVVLQGAIRKRVRVLRKIRSLYDGYSVVNLGTAYGFGCVYHNYIYIYIYIYIDIYILCRL